MNCDPLVLTDCASPVIQRIWTALKDGPWWGSDAERDAVLMPLCGKNLGAQRDVSPEVEKNLAKTCAHWALSLVPMTFEASAEARAMDEIFGPHPQQYYDKNSDPVSAAGIVAVSAVRASRLASNVNTNDYTEVAEFTARASHYAYRAGADVRPEAINLFKRLIAIAA